MRLRIKRILKAGEYILSFENLSFSRVERKKLKKFGIPLLDLSAYGIGLQPLDQIAFSIKCPNEEQANLIEHSIRQDIRYQIAKILANRKPSFNQRVVGIYSRRRKLVFGLTCILVILLLSSYTGVISSQQITRLGKQLLVSATGIKDHPSGPVKLAQSNGKRVANDSDRKYQANFKGIGSSGIYVNTSSDMTGSSSKYLKPDFTIIADPETLVRYQEWNPKQKKSGDQSVVEQFKLIFMTRGGFEGPVDLEVSGSCYQVENHLFPTQVKTLPGSATLIVNLSPQSPYQVCNNITITARGVAANGDLIIHEKKLVLAVREKPEYRGKLWHVTSSGNDLLGDGTDQSPFRTIQKGIDCAQTGDTVLVEKGLYRENISIKDKNRIIVTSRYLFESEESTIKSTIVEAPHGGWVATIGRSKQVTLQGFTIRKGKGNDNSPGGGIYCYNSSPGIYDNIVTRNENYSGYGAGIYCYDSKPDIRRNQILHNRNQDGHGAGIYCYDSDPDIEQNIIHDNRSSGGGSAIHLLESKQARIMHNLIYDNKSASTVLLYHKGTDGEFQIANNTVSGNQGDAIKYFGGTCYFQNNIIVQNHGYGIFTLDGTAQLAYNNVWANMNGKDTTDYFGLSGEMIKNNGNISRDPCFGNPLHGNYRLSFNSPCIDAGDPYTSGGASRVDMGALEYDHPKTVCGDVNRDGVIDYGDINFLCIFLFKRGTPPSPLETGDVDCDGKVDQLDLAYLYRFLYLYGSEPGINCQNRILATSVK
ncbi:MAG TPA: right-handed parallel beta-helix repeat-containing protein [candidate division Zixibacteria bacterium]